MRIEGADEEEPDWTATTQRTASGAVICRVQRLRQSAGAICSPTLLSEAAHVHVVQRRWSLGLRDERWCVCFVPGMPQPTITRHWNWSACVAYTLMLAALVFYFYVRIRCGAYGVTAVPL